MRPAPCSISDDWSIADCVRILRRRRAAILWITCMVGFGAAVISLAQSRVYESRALVEVQTLNENFLDLRNVYPTAASRVDPSWYVQTQADLLEQDSLIEEVARKLHLERRPEFPSGRALLGKLREDIRIVPLRNTRIIQIICDASDASLAADLANTLARTFIEQSIESRQRGARQTYASLQRHLEELSPGFSRQGARESAPAARLPAGGLFLRVAGANLHVYKTLLRQANDARTASVVRQSNVELISPAEPSIRPSKPNLPLTLVLGILNGFVLAVGLVMLQEQNAPVLRAPGEAGTLLALQELGAIPDAAEPKPSPPGLSASGSRKHRVERAVLEHRSSCLSESVRYTLTSILSANEDHPRILVVTSSRPMEGKTTVVSNLGFALAEIGRKTLLIDGDVRHPRLHEIFGQPNDRGMSDLLSKTDAIGPPLGALVKETAVPHLYLLPSGPHADAIVGLADSGRTARLFQSFREEFDYVLVDTPPCLEFADARNLARYADGLVLVVRANYTGRRTAQAAVARLEDDGTRMVGIILNRWNPLPREMAMPRFFSSFRADRKPGP